MPNTIPPIVSSSPPPLDPIDDDNDEDDNDDDFGDFTVADFGLHTDSAIQKPIPENSWGLPNLKETLPRPDRFVNGGISLELSTEDALPRPHTEVLDDDELFENADNASHDSVVSGVTDSGNCSASQNSNRTSPMPPAEVEDEAVVKADDRHLQPNGSAIQMPGTGRINCAVPAHLSLCDFNEAIDIDESRTLNISSETLVDDSFQPSENVLISSSIKNYSDEFSNDESSVDYEPKSKVFTACMNSEQQQSDTTSFPSLVGSNSNNGKPDEFGVRNSSTVPSELNRFQTMNTQSNLCPETNLDLTTLTTALETKVSSHGFEDNDCVPGMIIPDIPGLSDIDCDDDELGEFCGTESPDKYSSGAQSMDEQNIDAQFQSPSRRPTLVLSDDVTNVADINTQLVSTSEEIKDAPRQPTDTSSIEANVNSLEEKTYVVFNAAKEESCVEPFSSHPSSSQNPSFAEDFADEFADFSQADVEETPSSDVWAQAAHASSIQNALPPQEPLEFDDFDDYESAEFQSVDQKPNPEPSTNSYFDLNTIQSTLGEVLKENFPVPGGSNLSTELECVGTNGLSGLILDVEESPIWQGLRDLEATPSLSFQWPGSYSNRGLLGALNIDSRNILFGPKWNTVVPRFAANLGFSPLEPVRAVQNQPPSDPSPRPEVIQPQIVESIKPSSCEKGFQEVVPAAQFDWNDSGLTNPLDSSTHSTLLDLELLASFDNLASCSSGSSPSHAAVVCRSLLTNNGALATTPASGNPAMTTTPLQVEQLLASSQRSAPFSSLERKSRDPTLSPEAVRVLDTLPELAFLSARMLMFPVQGDRNENKL